MNKRLFFAFIMFLVVSGLVLAQDAKNTEFVDYLEFREVDIKDVLRQLARQYDINIVFSEAVSGLVTVQLHDITIDEALDSIITVNGFAYTKKESVIKVTTPEEAEREGKITKLFRLNNASADQLKSSLGKVLTSEGAIDFDIRSNSLIITDTPSVINKITRMIPELDGVTQQVLIETRFIETSVGFTEKIGVNWDVTAEASGSKRPTTFPFEPWGEDSGMFPVPEAAASYDTDKSQWTITSDFPFKGDGFFFPVGSELRKLGSFPTAAATFGDTGNFSFGTLDFSDLQAILDLIKTDTDSKLISSPRIVTMDNKQAEINVGKARPIPEFEYNSDTGEYQITGFTEKIEGVLLTVTPQINELANGKKAIRLKLKPKVTTFTNESVTFTNLGFSYPLLSERYADTEIMVEDGKTIVIGGLIETKKTETTTKVPLLGDLPFIGKLFRHTEVDPNTQTELLIFVTARILRSKSEALPGYRSNMIVAPPRPFKLDLRDIEIKK